MVPPLPAQIKGGDVIMRVGTTSVQNQSLVNLRELILGEPGSYVTLSFSRGGVASQPYDVSLMRGSPEYLDQHGGDAGTRSMAAPKAHAPTTSLGGASREGDEIERYDYDSRGIPILLLAFHIPAN